MAASGEMVSMPTEWEGVMVPMGVCPGMLMGKRSYSLSRPSNLSTGCMDNASKLLLPCCCLIEVKYSGTCSRGPGKNFVLDFERGVVSTFWLVAKAPSRLKASSLGVDRREVLGVKTFAPQCFLLLLCPLPAHFSHFIWLEPRTWLTP